MTITGGMEGGEKWVEKGIKVGEGRKGYFGERGSRCSIKMSRMKE